jgi:uncharacterized protein
MRPGFPIFLFVVFGIILLIDLYAFRGIRILTGSLQLSIRTSIHAVYWCIPIILMVLAIYISSHFREAITTKSHKILYFMIGLLLAVYIPKLVFIVFQLGNDIIRISGFLLGKLNQQGANASELASFLIRSTFMTKIGILIACVPLLSIIHGIAWGRYNYKVKKITLEFKSLPASFDGLRILQISDWHIGSFLGQEDKVKKSIDLINNQHADIVLFTGDFVNNVAEELESFIPLISQIKAPLGCYSILGNHDYGEYVPWESDSAHKKNMSKLFRLEKEAGFQLLRNESVVIEKGSDKIGIAGVENWGLPPFPQYGKIDVALKQIKGLPFKIMLSHDPSHWGAEILGKTDIDLTISGHTHGMQFGINLPGIKWSPIKWKYPRWCGLYQQDEQYLYVNVGIGYIAFPGRVGFLPEITVFELKRKLSN